MSLSALSESVVAYNIDLYSHLWSYGSKKRCHYLHYLKVLLHIILIYIVIYGLMNRKSYIRPHLRQFLITYFHCMAIATKKNISKAMIPDDQILKQMSLSALSESVVAYNIDLYSHLWSYGPKKPSRKFQTPCEMTKKNFNTHNITILSLSWLAIHVVGKKNHYVGVVKNPNLIYTVLR
ncbi:hypothetical protein GLOIN_2v1485104 [Rhizophagus irregularis DAOM 181602=DAOM 197198]|nr:hypothetical protein GLOIN_2v1485104 [Rhizophagus irregularis DAOM 181602=DAOM 197198]